MDRPRVRLVVIRDFLARLLAEGAGTEVEGRARAGSEIGAERIELYLPCSAGAPDGTVSVRLGRVLGTAPPQGSRFDDSTLELLVDERGLADAGLWIDGGALAVDEVSISGPGMERLVRAPRRDGRPARAFVPQHRGRPPRPPLAGLSAALVGCSRLGSLLASGLARAGLSEFTLIDGDVLEEHSVDAADCFHEDVGKPKVLALAGFLERFAPRAVLRPLAVPVESPEAFRACARADLVVSAPDEGRARLAAALAATSHHRPHLDVGTGVFDGSELSSGTEGWTAGADLRLFVPGQGCVLCAGGLDLRRRSETDWRRQRAGSLRSLNRMAAGRALTLLDGFLRAELDRSTWVRLSLAADGTPELLDMPWHVSPSCPLCSRRAGIGAAALEGPIPRRERGRRSPVASHGDPVEGAPRAGRGPFTA